MPHTNIELKAQIFDIQYWRAEFWNEELYDDWDKLIGEAIMSYMNNLDQWYPDIAKKQRDFINKQRTKDGGRI